MRIQAIVHRFPVLKCAPSTPKNAVDQDFLRDDREHSQSVYRFRIREIGSFSEKSDDNVSNPPMILEC